MRNLRLKAIWPECTGCQYYTKEVISFNKGKVIYIGSSSGVYVVVVQCNSNECLRYLNLETVAVKLNDHVDGSTLIGTVHSFAELQYCATWKNDSTSVIRVYSKTYYLQDPMPFVRGVYEIQCYTDPTIVTEVGKVIKLSSAQKAEFGNSRGDRVVDV